MTDREIVGKGGEYLFVLLTRTYRYLLVTTVNHQSFYMVDVPLVDVLMLRIQQRRLCTLVSMIHVGCLFQYQCPLRC